MWSICLPIILYLIADQSLNPFIYNHSCQIDRTFVCLRLVSYGPLTPSSCAYFSTPCQGLLLLLVKYPSTLKLVALSLWTTSQTRGWNSTPCTWVVCVEWWAPVWWHPLHEQHGSRQRGIGLTSADHLQKPQREDARCQTLWGWGDQRKEARTRGPCGASRWGRGQAGSSCVTWTKDLQTLSQGQWKSLW